MLDALLKVWPILAFLFGTTGAMLTWIGIAVWRTSRWTSDHDSRVVALEKRADTTDLTLRGFDGRLVQLTADVSRHSGIFQGEKP